MVPRETVSFVFPRVLMFPETKSRETLGLEGLYIKCFVIYLDFPLNNHITITKKTTEDRRTSLFTIVNPAEWEVFTYKCFERHERVIANIII